MNEYELFEMSRSAMEMIALASMNFVAVLFAYAMAAHLVGAHLTTWMRVTMTVCYSLFQIGPLLGMANHLDAVFRATAIYQAKYPNGQVLHLPELSFLAGLAILLMPLLVGWIVTIYYMHFYVVRGQHA